MLIYINLPLWSQHHEATCPSIFHKTTRKMPKMVIAGSILNELELFNELFPLAVCPLLCPQRLLCPCGQKKMSPEAGHEQGCHWKPEQPFFACTH